MDKYFLAFLLALTLHLSIIALFMLSLPVDTSVATQKKQQPVSIETTLIDEKAVTKKAQELKQREKKRERDRASQLAQEKQQLKQQRSQAEKTAKKQAQAEQKKIQALKQKQQKIKKQREVEEKKRRAEEKKRKVEATRKKAEKQKKIAAEKKQKAWEDELRLEVARQVEQDRRHAENVRIAASAYARTLIRDKITQNWKPPSSIPKKLKCKLKIELINSGDVMLVDVITSSGNLSFDESAERAVYKASPLPVPKDPNVFKEFRSFSLEFYPDKK